MKMRRHSGFTLIELTLVLGMSVMVASALIGMFKAHIQMLTQAAKYKFLAQDAPFIGLLLTRTIGNAEDYRIYASGTVARSSSGTAVLTGSAVKLWMRQPNSTFLMAVVSSETPTSGPFSGHPGIYFYLTNTGIFSATPNWELAGLTPGPAATSAPGATFDATTGVLLATLNGSYNDWYQFSAEKK
jgi:hypothetical protein